MQVNVEAGEGLEKRLKVDLPAERLDREVDKRLQQLARTVRMDGFRPGKVPLRVVRQRFAARVREEVAGDLVQATFLEAAAQEKLRPAGAPRIEIHDAGTEGGFAYTATFEVVPEVSVANADQLEVKRPAAEVTDADVDAMIEKLRSQRTTWSRVERAAQDGDTVKIDFTGYVDGEAFEGGAAEDVPLRLGSGAMIEGFESGLIGAAEGEERKLEVKFPDDYRAERLKGKEATFEVKIREVQEPVLPPVDEDFIKAFGVEDGTAESLRAEIRANMERELRQKLRAMTKERVLDALLEHNPVDVPRVMIEEEAGRLKKQTQQELAQSGQGNAIDFPVSMFEPQARRRVALGLLIGDIIRTQQIKPEESRVRSTVEEFASSYENPDEVVNYYLADKEQRAAIENLVLEEQAIDWLLEQARVEDEAKSFDEMMG
jgi:trigger factor